LIYDKLYSNQLTRNQISEINDNDNKEELISSFYLTNKLK